MPSYSFSGLVNGDTAATLTHTGSVYDNAHVQQASKIVVSGLGISSIGGGNASVPSDYVLTTTSQEAAARITPKALSSTASIGGTLTKVYDGTTTTSATVSGSVTGGIAGDVLNLNTSGVTLAYNNAHVASASKVAATGSGTLTIASSLSNSVASDYSFTAPLVVDAAATITPKALTSTASIGGTSTKVYDGSTAAPIGATVTGTVDGALSGDILNLNTSGVSLAYNNAHVAAANVLIASGTSTFTIGATAQGSQLSDYSLTQPTIANAAATITPKTLTSAAAIGGTLTKTYDGTTAAPGATVAGSVSGAIAGDTLGLDTSSVRLAYNNAHVGFGTAVVATGNSAFTINTSSSGSQTGDYLLTQPNIANAAATITAKALTATASIGGTLTKEYDGTTVASNANVIGTVTGGIAGDSISLDATSIRLNYDNAHVNNASTILASGTSAFKIDSSNSTSLTTDYQMPQPVIANV
ncbi:MAG: YDG domain-containing protein, partial [Burkholderiaceae bacterium]